MPRFGLSISAGPDGLDAIIRRLNWTDGVALCPQNDRSVDPAPHRPRRPYAPRRADGYVRYGSIGRLGNSGTGSTSHLFLPAPLTGKTRCRWTSNRHHKTSSLCCVEIHAVLPVRGAPKGLA